MQLLSRRLFWGLSQAVCALGLAAGGDAQQPAVSATPAAPGLESPWDVGKILTALSSDNQQLKPVLATLQPQQWAEEKGAPRVYIEQWNTAKRQVDDVVFVAGQLAKSTENLPLALDLYFRLEALDTSVHSIDAAAHKYGDRATADKLAELAARNFGSREQFRNYLRDLSNDKTQQFKVADEEAQRCRGMLSQQQTPKPVRKSRR